MDRFEVQEGQLLAGAVSIPLTPKERAVLRVLMDCPGRPVSSTILIDRVWGASPVGTESLHRCISTLRGKFERHGAGAAVSTVYGYGYRLDLRSGPAPAALVPDNARAAEGFRQAMEMLGRRSKPEAELSRKRLAQLRQDHPGFIPAYVFGAHVEITTAMLGYDEPETVARTVRALASDILKLNPSSADARSARGFATAVIEGDDNGFDDLDAAVFASPDDWLARYYRAWALAGKGEFPAAIEDFEHAQRCHSETTALLGGFGHVLCCAGQPDRALSILRAASEFAQMSAAANASHAINASLLGFHEEAIAAGERIASVPRMSATLLASLPYALARAGRRDEAAQWLERIEADVDCRPAPAMVAAARLALGDTAAARALLARAGASRCPYRHIQRFDPRLSSLRG